MRETVKDSRRTALQRALLLDLLAQTAFLFWGPYQTEGGLRS